MAGIYTTNTASSSAICVCMSTSLLTDHTKDVPSRREIQPAASTRPTSTPDDNGARLVRQGLTKLQYHHVENSTKKTKDTANLLNGEGQ